MITEKRFAASHHAFWRELLPMGERYIRAVNAGLARFCEPLTGTAAPKFHGVLSELAFLMFVRAVQNGKQMSALTPSEVQEDVSAATSFIERFRKQGRGPLAIPRDTEIREATALAERMADFFQKAADGPLLLQPTFPGCGWLSECQGDVFSSNVLFELKSGTRPFRMLDIKQVLIYCALDFSRNVYDIKDICLVNPRTGSYFSVPINSLCELVAGRSSVDVLGDIVEYASDTAGEYRTG